VHPPTQDEE
jgi:hypothetical protein